MGDKPKVLDAVLKEAVDLENIPIDEVLENLRCSKEGLTTEAAEVRRVSYDFVLAGIKLFPELSFDGSWNPVSFDSSASWIFSDHVGAVLFSGCTSTRKLLSAVHAEAQAFDKVLFDLISHGFSKAVFVSDSESLVRILCKLDLPDASLLPLTSDIMGQLESLEFWAIKYVNRNQIVSAHNLARSIPV